MDAMGRQMARNNTMATAGKVEGQIGGFWKGACTKRGGQLGGFRQVVNTTR